MTSRPSTPTQQEDPVRGHMTETILHDHEEGIVSGRHGPGVS